MKPWLYIVVFSTSALAPAVQRTGPGGAETRPASTDSRVHDAQVKIDQIQQFASKLQRNENVDLDSLEAEFPLPTRDTDKRTRELRDQVLTLEEVWVSARAARAIATENVQIASVLDDNAISEGDSPTPHSLAETQAVPLAVVRFRRGRYEKALESLPIVNSAEARYMEARCLDALDRVDEARVAYKKARELAGESPFLLTSIDRALAALEWKVKFGKPEDLMNPIRNSKFTGFQSLQKAPGSPDVNSGKKIDAGADHANKSH